MVIAHKMVGTAVELDGFPIKRNLGIVPGITIRSRSTSCALGGPLHAIVGRIITAFTNLCEKAPGDAFDMIFQHSLQMSANAIVWDAQ